MPEQHTAQPVVMYRFKITKQFYSPPNMKSQTVTILANISDFRADRNFPELGDNNISANN